jgi:hypothetical protein
LKHAGESALRDLSKLLEELRRRPDLQERRPGIFYERGRARLHFHEDPSGLFADLKGGTNWVRLDVTGDDGRIEPLRRIDEPTASEPQEGEMHRLDLTPPRHAPTLP